jgi:DNA (cytosine-5)-methyltransferase 1
MTLNVLSLFSGIGGLRPLELGLERAGMTTVGQVELDPYCNEVLATHWPEVPRHDDVRTAPEWWLGEQRPRVDVVCGGFPCQPFSVAGKQLGTADERWGWPWMADVIRAVGPRYVVVENVSALIRNRDAFGWMLGDLADLGFDAEWTLYHASDFGAPHPRQRLYVVAYTAGDGRRPHDLLVPSEERAAPLATGGLPRPSVAERRVSAGAWLEREPRVARLVDGIPHQVDRLNALGNAVVPQVAQFVGRLIIDHHELLEAA